jgi:hypothetical protein
MKKAKKNLLLIKLCKSDILPKEMLQRVNEIQVDTIAVNNVLSSRMTMLFLLSIIIISWLCHCCQQVKQSRSLAVLK